MKRLKYLLLLFLILPVSLQARFAALEPAKGTIVRIDLDDVVHPVSADYVRQGLTHAKEIGARAVILRINTPGGLADSMRAIVGAILDSDIPVITWVGPNGARAASAGFFILLAGDVAVMAPGTNTGAAHPVSGSGAKIEDVMEKKVVSDLTAYVRSYVTKRGRNVAMAELGVVESRSFSAQEAADQNLVDGIVSDVSDIVRRFDGRRVRQFNGNWIVLNLGNATVESYDMSARQRLLSYVLDPNLALILGMIGLLGLYFELTHPGMIVPGVAGAICLILSLFAFNLLPINGAGALLILLAIVLFVLEASITSHGILGLGGIVSMIAGASMLVEGPIPELRIHLATTIAVTLPLAAIMIFLLRLALASRRLKSVSGEEGMIGEVGVAKSEIFGNGRVFVHGETWNASSSSPIPEGAKVRVVKFHGLKVEVEEEKEGHMTEFQVLIGVMVIVIIWIANSLNVLREYERGVVFRIGRLLADPKGPGLIWLFWPIDRIVRVSLRTITMDVPTQDVITKDNVTVKVNAVVYFRVVDPRKAIVEVENYLYATSQLAQTTLRSVLGEVGLDDLLSKREVLNQRLQEILDTHTDAWGIKVALVELKGVDLPESMQRAMARQAEAEREKRAKVIHAQGEFEASQRLSEAAAVISSQPVALQLRYLQTLTEIGMEKNTTIVFPLPIDILDYFAKARGKD